MILVAGKPRSVVPTSAEGLVVLTRQRYHMVRQSKFLLVSASVGSHPQDLT